MTLFHKLVVSRTHKCLKHLPHFMHRQELFQCWRTITCFHSAQRHSDYKLHNTINQCCNLSYVTKSRKKQVIIICWKLSTFLEILVFIPTCPSESEEAAACPWCPLDIAGHPALRPFVWILWWMLWGSLLSHIPVADGGGLIPYGRYGWYPEWHPEYPEW